MIIFSYQSNLYKSFLFYFILQFILVLCVLRSTSVTMEPWDQSILCNMKWNVQSFENCIVAPSEFAGPIAIAPKKGNPNRGFNIYFATGELILHDFFPEDYDVVAMGWTSNVVLLVVLANGRGIAYYIDGTPSKMFAILSDEDEDAGITIKSAYIIDVGIVMLKSDYQLTVVKAFVLYSARPTQPIPENQRYSFLIASNG